MTDAGFAVLGFADHTPWPYGSGCVNGMRMWVDQLQSHPDTVKALGKRCADQIRIPVGMEVLPFWTSRGFVDRRRGE